MRYDSQYIYKQLPIEKRDQFHKFWETMNHNVSMLRWNLTLLMAWEVYFAKWENMWKKNLTPQLVFETVTAKWIYGLF